MSGNRAIYLDSSAVVKLIISESESANLQAHLVEAGPKARLTSSELVLAEVLRAVARSAPEALPAARDRVIELELIQISRALVTAAAALVPPELRTLDAIHLATALSLGEDLAEVVTYDRRMQAAATAVGVPWVAPGQSNPA